MDELAVGRVARVRDQVDLREAWRGDVPAIGFDGDVVLQERARLGAAIEAPSELSLVRLKAPVHLPGAEGEELCFERRREAEAPAHPGQPEREERLHAHRPRKACGFPDCRQDPKDLGAIPRRPLATPRPRSARRRAVEQAQGMLSVVARDLAELV